MPNMPNKLRRILKPHLAFNEAAKKAYQYVKEGRLDKFSKLMKDFPKLASQTFNDSHTTLFILACRDRQFAIVNFLLEQPKDRYFLRHIGENYRDYADYYAQQRTAKGNSGVAYLFYREPGIDDANVLKILELIYSKQPDIDKNGFVSVNNYGDIPLIQAVRDKLPKSTQYLCKVLADNRRGILLSALTHQNKQQEYAISIAQSNGFFNDLMEILASTTETTPDMQVCLLAHVAANASIKPAGNEEYAGSPEHRAHKEKILSLIQECLPKVSQEEVNKLASGIFELKLGVELLELLGARFYPIEENKLILLAWHGNMPRSFMIDNLLEAKQKMLEMIEKNTPSPPALPPYSPYVNPPAYSETTGASAAAVDRPVSTPMRPAEPSGKSFTR